MSNIRLVTQLVKLVLNSERDQNLLADACQVTREIGLDPNTPRWMFEYLPDNIIKEESYIRSVDDIPYLIEIIQRDGTSTIFLWRWALLEFDDGIYTYGWKTV